MAQISYRLIEMVSGLREYYSINCTLICQQLKKTHRMQSLLTDELSGINVEKGCNFDSLNGYHPCIPHTLAPGSQGKT